MGARGGKYGNAVDGLPPGAVLILPRVTWDEYEHMLDDLSDRPGVRVSYDEGTLEVSSPSAEHEQYRELVLQAARACAEERHLPLETRGSTTWTRRDVRKGVESDTCFYVAKAYRVIGLRTIDLDIDPPPDIVVEIDLTNASLGKIPIYASLGVPEIWWYDGTHVHVYVLTGDHYTDANESRFLPGLTAALLLETIDVSRTRGQTEALRALREHLRSSR